MSDERLDEAVRALRDETAGRPVPSELTRARIMGSVRDRQRRRVTWVTIAVPLAAVLAVGTALATASGGFEQAWQRLMPSVERETELPEPAAQPNPVPVAVEEPPVVEEPDAGTQPDEADEEEAHSEAVGSGGRGQTAATVASRKPVDQDPQGVYRAAHRAHFEQRDYGAALTSYERYLSAAPSGRFALEASYNRALCLARLGRADQAVRALQPFAQGRFGSYRQREAASLIEALRGPVNADAEP